MRLRPGVAVVIEGVDSAGKSTLVADLLADPRWTTAPERLHLPSGVSPLTAEVYETLESVKPESGLARQLFHLACHAENQPAIARRRRDTGLLLDRWWWSTLAYSTDLPDAEQRTIADVVAAIWSSFRADLVCCLFEPLRDDANNSRLVANAYERLARDHEGPTLHVPRTTRSERVDTVLEALAREGLLA